MQKITGTYRDGAVTLDTPVNWPEGTRTEVTPLVVRDGDGSTGAPAEVRQELLDALNDPERYGLDESLWPQSPQEIRLLLAHMDAAEPLALSPEEVAAMESERQVEKERQKEFTRKSWQDVERLFE